MPHRTYTSFDLFNKSYFEHSYFMTNNFTEIYFYYQTVDIYGGIFKLQMTIFHKI